MISNIEYIGSEKIELGKKWLSESKRKPLLVTGQNSCGKTTFIKTLFKDYQITEVHELDDLEDILQKKTFIKLCFVIEHIEGLSSFELRKLETICRKKYVNPLVLTLDDAYEKETREFRSLCEWILLKPNIEHLVIMILSICKANDIIINAATVSFFLDSCNHNVRQCLNLIYFYMKTKRNKIKDLPEVSEMDFDRDAFTESTKIFNGIFNYASYYKDYEDIKFYIHENHISNVGNMQDLSKNADVISFSDLLSKKDDYDDTCSYLIQSRCAESAKSIRKCSKLRFPSVFQIRTKKTMSIADLYSSSSSVSSWTSGSINST